MLLICTLHCASQFFKATLIYFITCFLHPPPLKVTYETVGFLEKNRDTIKSDVAKLLRESTNEIVHSMFYTPLSRTGSLSAATKRGGPSSATPLFSRRAPFVSKKT